jgi:outer membrane receptor for Fe3+-dicitrate
MHYSVRRDTAYSRKGSVLDILPKVHLHYKLTKLKQKCNVSVRYVATEPDVISERAQYVHDPP